jgi:SAM-dependent methyltransferase
MTEDRYAKIDYRRLIAWDERLEREWPFFEEVLRTAPSKQIVDLGSGTGDHARFLASKGFDVTGVDSSPAMLEKARAEPAENVRFVEGDLRELHALGARFGGAICVGNVLPHLTQDDDLQRLASAARGALLPGAPILFQFLNYDRIEIQKERALPLSFLRDPEDPLATMIFLRPMELLPGNRAIFMPTTLRQRPDREPPLELVSSRRVEIRTWRKSELEAALRRNGFASIEVWGSYQKAPYVAADSRDVIMVAR